jgi:hypothetical protein
MLTQKNTPEGIRRRRKWRRREIYEAGREGERSEIKVEFVDAPSSGPARIASIVASGNKVFKQATNNNHQPEKYLVEQREGVVHGL